MGIMRWAVYNRLKAIYGDIVSNTYGYITKNTRIENNLEKTQRIDALCIAKHPKAQKLESYFYCKKARVHNRQLYKANKLKGGRLKAKQAPKEVFGFRLFDKVVYNGIVCFITARRQRGSFAIKTLEGQTISGNISYKKLRFVEPRRTILTIRRKADSSPA